MKLSAFKQQLDSISSVNFVQPNGAFIPRHFHVTEAGLTTKNFIDCGGTVRTEKTVSFQVWVAEDTEHRLAPAKLKNIIGIAEKLFGNDDLEVEVEYQIETIGRYGLAFDGENFQLTTKQTDCLAKEKCGIPYSEEKPELAAMESSSSSCCSPGGGCC